jgi:hypothetical protein
MDVQHQRVLDLLIGYWREQFNLVPATDVAEACQIPEVETLRVLEEMAKAGSVELHRRRVGTADPGALEPSATEILRATYVLPSRSILRARFQEAKQDLGRYKNLLYQGLSQDELFRFQPALLDHYRQQPDIEVTPGLIATRRAALLRDDVHPVYVRYRWATGASGDRHITVNLWDLAELSQAEQALWSQHEIGALGGMGSEPSV